MIGGAVIYAGLAYTVAPSVWLIGELYSGSDASAAAVSMLGATLVLQVVVVWLAAPILVAEKTQWYGFDSVLMLAILPWPVMIAVLQFCTVPFGAMAVGQLILVMVSGCLCLALVGLRKLMSRGTGRELIQAVIRFVPPMVMWMTHETWLAWLVP